MDLEKRKIPFYFLVFGLLFLSMIAFFNYFYGSSESVSDTNPVLVFYPNNPQTTLSLTNKSDLNNVYCLTSGNSINNPEAISEAFNSVKGTIYIYFYFTSSEKKSSIKLMSEDVCLFNWTQDASVIINSWLLFKISYDCNTKTYSVHINGRIVVLNEFFLTFEESYATNFVISHEYGSTVKTYFKVISRNF